jgi:AraC family transcriptional regulator
MNIQQHYRGGLAPWRHRKIQTHLLTDLSGSLRTTKLAQLVNLSHSHFCRAFKQSFGVPPHEYLMRTRIERARTLLSGSNSTIAEIAVSCGLSDQPHLTRLFRRFVGETPGAWRRRNRRADRSAPVVTAANALFEGSARV